MKINLIHYSDDFKKQFKLLPLHIKIRTKKTELLLRENPFHPSLRLHKLKGKLIGLWSISIDRKYRIIFEPLDDGVIIFSNIGTHAIYED